MYSNKYIWNRAVLRGILLYKNDEYTMSKINIYEYEYTIGGIIQ